MKISINRQCKRFLPLIFILLFITGLTATQLMLWKPLPVVKFGTKRVVRENKSNILYYRSTLGKNLDLGMVEQARIRISVFSKKDSLKFKYTVIVDKEKKHYEVKFRRKVGSYFYYEDIYLNLLPGKHHIQIDTPNRNAYFRAFYPKYKKVYPPISLAKPNILTDTVRLNKGASWKTYYVATVDKPYQTIVDDKHILYGYARASIMSNSPSAFEIYRNGAFVEKVVISNKKTKLYSNAKYKNISIGKKFSVQLVPGKNTIVLKPVGTNPVIFRIFKERKAVQ